jgi:hypothetical protein
MKRNLATPTEIAEYHASKRERRTTEGFNVDRGSPDGMTREEIKKMLKGASRSGHKIPKALLAKSSV